MKLDRRSFVRLISVTSAVVASECIGLPTLLAQKVQGLEKGSQPTVSKPLHLTIDDLYAMPAATPAKLPPSFKPKFLKLSQQCGTINSELEAAKAILQDIESSYATVAPGPEKNDSSNAFQDFDQKSNQMMNMLSDLLKNLQDTTNDVIRNML